MSSSDDTGTGGSDMEILGDEDEAARNVGVGSNGRRIMAAGDTGERLDTGAGGRDGDVGRWAGTTGYLGDGKLRRRAGTTGTLDGDDAAAIIGGGSVRQEATEGGSSGERVVDKDAWMGSDMWRIAATVGDGC